MHRSESQRPVPSFLARIAPGHATVTSSSKPKYANYTATVEHNGVTIDLFWNSKRKYLHAEPLRGRTYSLGLDSLCVLLSGTYATRRAAEQAFSEAGIDLDSLHWEKDR